MIEALSESQLDGLRAGLRQRLAALRVEIREHLLRSDEERYLDLAGRVHDLVDESVADLLVDVDLATIDREVQEVAEVEAALARMAQGGYAWCLACHGPIEYARLLAAPAASRCHLCQTRHEQTYVQPGRASL